MDFLKEQTPEQTPEQDEPIYRIVRRDSTASVSSIARERKDAQPIHSNEKFFSPLYYTMSFFSNILIYLAPVLLAIFASLFVLNTTFRILEYSVCGVLQGSYITRFLIDSLLPAEFCPTILRIPTIESVPTNASILADTMPPVELFRSLAISITNGSSVIEATHNINERVLNLHTLSAAVMYKNNCPSCHLLSKLIDGYADKAMTIGESMTDLHFTTKRVAGAVQNELHNMVKTLPRSDDTILSDATLERISRSIDSSLTAISNLLEELFVESTEVQKELKEIYGMLTDIEKLTNKARNETEVGVTAQLKDESWWWWSNVKEKKQEIKKALSDFDSINKSAERSRVGVMACISGIQQFRSAIKSNHKDLVNARYATFSVEIHRNTLANLAEDLKNYYLDDAQAENQRKKIIGGFEGR